MQQGIDEIGLKKHALIISMKYWNTINALERKTNEVTKYEIKI